jgi:hypothetical protein
MLRLLQRRFDHYVSHLVIIPSAGYLLYWFCNEINLTTSGFALGNSEKQNLSGKIYSA